MVSRLRRLFQVLDPNTLIDLKMECITRLSHMVGGDRPKDGTPGGRDLVMRLNILTAIGNGVLVLICLWIMFVFGRRDQLNN